MTRAPRPDHFNSSLARRGGTRTESLPKTGRVQRDEAGRAQGVLGPGADLEFGREQFTFGAPQHAPSPAQGLSSRAGVLSFAVWRNWQTRRMPVLEASRKGPSDCRFESCPASDSYPRRGAEPRAEGARHRGPMASEGDGSSLNRHERRSASEPRSPYEDASGQALKPELGW